MKTVQPPFCLAPANQGFGITCLCILHSPVMSPSITGLTPQSLDLPISLARHRFFRSVGHRTMRSFHGRLKSGETWQSPVGLLVHKDAGLLVSYRGALRFGHHIDLPIPATSPCDTCADKPCLTACPVGAIGADGYDVPACKAHIATDPVCRAGCRVRLSCPISQSYGRTPAQTAFHMEAFVRE